HKGPNATCKMTHTGVRSADVALGADESFDSGVFRTWTEFVTDASRRAVIGHPCGDAGTRQEHPDK
ncbi:MAG TPA: hypothetical protein VIK38_03925, partial [Coriobacteriia bacterium]